LLFFFLKFKLTKKLIFFNKTPGSKIIMNFVVRKRLLENIPVAVLGRHDHSSSINTVE
jgi:hypothetical protein